MTRLERGFLIRIFFPEGKIDTFYDFQPELIRNSEHLGQLQKNRVRRAIHPDGVLPQHTNLHRTIEKEQVLD
ncbi:MAG: hypothetical protein ACOC6H_04655 [Thermoproteota archaeon]